MPDLLKEQIAAKITPGQYMRLCHKVESTWKQPFGVVKVTKKKQKKVSVIVELQDKTRHQIAL